MAHDEFGPRDDVFEQALATPEPEPASEHHGAYDRRSVLLGGASLAAIAASLAACKEPEKPYSGKAPKQNEGVPPDSEPSLGELMPILVAFADTLFPTDELGPGAKDAGMEVYLEKNLADPRMKAIKSVVTRGAIFLGRAARKEHGKGFWELTYAERESWVQRFARNEVRPNNFTPVAFVRVMLALTLECFFGDPRHGGNKGEMGWQWMGGLNWAGRVAGASK